MEEWVGERWHNFIVKAANNNFDNAAVYLKDVLKSVEIIFRAGGGDKLIRVTPSSLQKIGGRRNWIQKIAGQGERAALNRLDNETLSLPEKIAVFNDKQLNRDLYLWLAALSSAIFGNEITSDNWIEKNILATNAALNQFAGLKPVYKRLLKAHLATRSDLSILKGRQLAAEKIIQEALINSKIGILENPADTSPVWLWINDFAISESGVKRDNSPKEEIENKNNSKNTQEDNKRRIAKNTQDSSSKNGLIMFFRAESILSWSEFVKVKRTDDDDDDQDSVKAADDMEQLHIADNGKTLAARVKFDLDLPSASHDDLPVGQGELLPEWDYKKQELIKNACQLTRFKPRIDDEEKINELLFKNQEKLRKTTRQVQRKFEALRAAPIWQRGLIDGEELDLDSWVRYKTNMSNTNNIENPAIYASRMKKDRSLAVLILADLSLSTDAYATQNDRVIDLIKDSLLVFGNALNTVGDEFEILGFSSIRRKLRINEIKRFDEPFSNKSCQNIEAIKPGFYTRMGGAIRWGTKRLSERGEHQKLLLILSDGKPNDLDKYEGRYGLEDTRQAVHEARMAQIVPFCTTIDKQANAYLPKLFGTKGYALIHQPEQLAKSLSQVYVRLTAGIG